MINDHAEESKREIYFWPGCARGVDRMNREATEARASVLFGSDLVKDPLDESQRLRFWPTTLWVQHKEPSTFRLLPSQFLQDAEKKAPKKPQASASAFSQWVYSIYGSAFGDDDDRERGKELEKEIFDQRRRAVCSIDDEFLSGIRSGWRLYHNGLHLGQTGEIKFFEIDHLRVNGEPLRVSPDLLYKNDSKSEVIIVEIKHSRQPITSNLWPNVWAQLWCYAQLDVARDAKDLTVVGEVWGERWTRSRGQGRSRIDGCRLVCLRASVRRDPRAPAYDRFFRRLFDIYRGEC